MSKQDKISAYVTEVCKQIRFRRAHPLISKELEQHMLDARDAYVEKGFDTDTATKKSIIDAGDAAIVGANFDRLHRPKAQWAMFLWVFLLVCLGIGIQIALYGQIHTSVWGIVIGIPLMLLMYFLDFSLLGKYPYAGYWLVFACIVLLGGGYRNVGARDAMAVMSYMYLLFPLLLAGILFTQKGRGYKGIVNALCYFVIFGMTLIGGGGAIHYAMIVFVLFCAVIVWGHFGVNRLLGFASFLLVFLGLFFAYFAILAVTSGQIFSHQFYRLEAAFFPARDPYGFGWFPLLIREIVFGQSQNLEILTYGPEFLLTGVIARFGFIPFVLVCLVLLAFLGYGFYRCFRQKAILAFLVSFTVMLTFATQIAFFVLANLGIVITVFSLPFITGNTELMIINFMLMGVLLSVFRTGNMPLSLEKRTGESSAKYV